MKKIYNPNDIEKYLYKNWEKNGYFKPSKKNTNDSYCIMMPPPNITGSLHMGHAFQQTIMDILIRYKRMCGKNTLWQMGTDHAGIATQILVERKIFIEEKKKRYDYDREYFIDKIWKWKKKSHNIIKTQISRLGNSVDWERERFTMDKTLSNAVIKAFIMLYRENLIYRSKMLVNWDTKLKTAISDLEIENREVKNFLWYLRYPLIDNIRTIDNLDYLVVSSTRPETIIGDTALAVNPLDKRYKNLIGKFVNIPIINRRIPIIGDINTNINFGTGCVKITPAHDFNDYNIGKHHMLPMINFLTFDGCIRNKAKLFDIQNNFNKNYYIKIPLFLHGKKIIEARKLIIKKFNDLNLLDKVEKHKLYIPHSDRSGVIIEPMLTDQWYLRTKPLAKAAIKAVEKKKIKFIPKQYKKMYFSWMFNIKDWCISRQIWWGHRIPAWYDKDGKIYVGENELKIRKYYNLNKNIILTQENDVLDTWFSSSLWTFSSLGWPKSNEDLNTFHPTNVMVSGFDIIFFWIARMIMITMHFIKNKKGDPQVPFKIVYITGLVRDEEGYKMSKSKGNIIDPLDMLDGISLENLIKKRTKNMLLPKLANKIRINTIKQFPNGIKPHGADALRFTLASLASTGRDINWDMKRLNGYHNFCNKLWNASYFVLKNTKDKDFFFNKIKKKLSFFEHWIISEFNQTVKIFRESIDNYRFDLSAKILYNFTWNKFCDWYLEITKLVIKNNYNYKYNVLNTLVMILESLLRLAHPIIPFITEKIWKNLKVIIFNQNKNITIMLQSFPNFDINLINKNLTKNFESIKKIIVSIRNIRSNINILPDKSLNVLIRSNSSDLIKIINENLDIIINLAKIKNITLISLNNNIPINISYFIDETEIIVPIEGIINKNLELKVLSKKIFNMNNLIKLITKKINNKNFILNAPEYIVIKEKERLEVYKKNLKNLLNQKKKIKDLN